MGLQDRRTERLQAKLNHLKEQLGEALTNDTDLDAILADIKRCEAELKDLELKALVKKINKREAAKREALKKVIEIGVVNRDVFTNDMQLHKSKSKLAPELYKFKEENSVYFDIEYNGQLKYRFQGRLELHDGVYSYSTKETSPYESFEQACEYNNILLKDVTVAQIKRQIKSIKKATEKLKAAEEAYSEAKKANNAYFLQGEGVFNQQNASIYTLYTKF